MAKRPATITAAISTTITHQISKGESNVAVDAVARWRAGPVAGTPNGVLILLGVPVFGRF